MKNRLIEEGQKNNNERSEEWYAWNKDLRGLSDSPNTDSLASVYRRLDFRVSMRGKAFLDSYKDENDTPFFEGVFFLTMLRSTRVQLVAK